MVPQCGVICWGREWGGQFIDLVKKHDHLALIGSRPKPVLEDLKDPAVDLIVIGLPVHERPYWIEQSLEAGKRVLSLTPLAPTLDQTRSLLKQLGPTGIRLAIDAPVWYTQWAQKVRQLANSGLVAVEMAIHMPQTSLATSHQGLLACTIPYLSLLVHSFGPVDSVWSRTRSLGLNRPQEDWAAVLLRFKSGLEGVVRLSGLGTSAKAQVLGWGVGREEQVSHTVDPDGALSDQLAVLDSWIRGGGDEFYGLRAFEAGVNLACWIDQGARHNRELSFKEIAHG